MRFTHPEYLLLLLLIPLFVWIAWSRRTMILHRWRKLSSMVIRSLIILLIVLALAGLQRLQLTDNLATIFLLDMSDSVGQTGHDMGLRYIREALTAMAPQDRGGIVVFGREALVERTPSERTMLTQLASVPNSSYSNLASGIGLALASFPTDTARRIIILSDGAANLGDARQAAQIAAASGVQISAVPLPRAQGLDVQLTNLHAPSMLRAGEQFDLQLQLSSSAPMSVPLQIFSEGQLVAQSTIRLQAGEQNFSVPLVAGETGFSTFEARIFPPTDTFPQNNVLESYSEVSGPLKLLLIAANPDEGQPVAAALRSTGLQLDEISPASMPSELRALSEYAALVLVNLPSFTLAPRQLELIQRYVRDLGHGLLVIGGDQSYGPGGYYQTPLDETLPVNMTITDTERLPSMSLFMVIDKSGSMADGGTTPGSPRKVELAKEAIYRSVELLVPWDRVGVVAFDNAGQWVVKPTLAQNISVIQDAVGTIRASGGTDILAGLKLAAADMLNETSQVRHIVLLTDGGANPTGIPELTQSLAEDGVSVSVVAIGQGYASFLEDIAEIGGGRFYYAPNAAVIPQIFAQETSLASRSYVVEEPFNPTVAGPSPILLGLEALPVLQGYVATSLKLTAQPVLRGGEKQDPLLAQWQYGLGRSVAWTSDAKAQWAGAWLNWQGFPRFWSQAVRWTIVEGQGGGLESQIRQEGSRAIITAEALDAQGRYRNNLQMTLNLIAPNLETETVPMLQVAPGLYEGEFQPPEQGTYFLRLTGQAGDTVVAAETRGFVMAYSPEYRQGATDPTLLSDIAAIGHGQVGLTLQNPGRAFEHTLPAAEATSDLWPWLLLAAVLLLPVDVGMRRIIFGWDDLLYWWAKLRRRLPQQQPARPAEASPLLQKLKRTRKRAAPKIFGNKPTVPTESPPPSPPPKSEPEQEEVDTVRRLLKAKRRKRR